MKTVIGNWENGNVTTINTKYCSIHGHYLTDKQIDNAALRMGIKGLIKFRNVPVAGAKLADADVSGIKNHRDGCEICR